MSLHTRLSSAWYQPGLPLWWLLPLEWLYCAVIRLRRWCYRVGLWRQWRAPVPVIVVGNISVGGTGKTPLVIAIVDELRRRGYRPGVVSRGYRSRAPYYPFFVSTDTPAVHSGDEPLLIAQQAQCPVVIGADRPDAVAQLLARHACDIIVADDGLQHYALGRDVEIVVIDAERGLGNRHCLPVGPLREPARRLSTAHFVVINGAEQGSEPALLKSIVAYLADATRCQSMNLQALALRQLATQHLLPIERWTGERAVHAVAGIGNPARFFNMLRGLGFSVTEHAFTDHHSYREHELQFGDDHPIIMTEKDAVKCRDFANDRLWSLQIGACLSPRFFDQLAAELQRQRQ